MPIVPLLAESVRADARIPSTHTSSNRDISACSEVLERAV